MNIKQANLNDVLDVARLALVLWPHHSMHAMALKISETIQENKGAYFLALDKNETIGFAQVNLRHDYVEGTHSSPVGYLEGIFVVENYRQQLIFIKYHGCAHSSTSPVSHNYNT